MEEVGELMGHRMGGSGRKFFGARSIFLTAGLYVIGVRREAFRRHASRRRRKGPQPINAERRWGDGFGGDVQSGSRS